MDFSDDTYRLKISAVFADMHLSVITASSRMVFSSRNIENFYHKRICVIKLLELRRFNYVTPTNYLELVKGYRALLAEKSSELGSSASKLANGLAKLEDAKEQVETLSKELEVKKVIVAQSELKNEEFFTGIN